MGYSPIESHPWLNLRETSQPGADLPAAVNPFWFVMQPEKTAAGLFPDVRYSLREQQFWAASVFALNARLARSADGEPDTYPAPVARVKSPQETRTVNSNINAYIHQILMDNPTAVDVEFLNGALWSMAPLYNSLRGYPDAQKRILPVIVGGTHANRIERTAILTPVPDKPLQDAGLIIVHDDVGETMAALAVFVEHVRSARTHRETDAKFIDAFNDKDSNHVRLYDELIRTMKHERIAAAIPIYKNRLFAQMLEQAAGDMEDSWQIVQTQFLVRGFPDYPNLWLMGDGLDTFVTIRDIRRFLPDEILSHPAVIPLFDHTGTSQLRIGCTVEGLIALRGSYEDLVRWTAHGIRQQLENIIANSLIPLRQRS